MDKYKWTGRYVLAGLALTFWAVTFWATGELPPVFLSGLVGTAWGVLFASREREKASVQKLSKDAVVQALKETLDVDTLLKVIGAKAETGK